MNTTFDQIQRHLKQKKIDLVAYQEYLQALERNFETLTKNLTQRNIPLREFYDFLTQHPQISTIEDKQENLDTLKILEKQIGGYQLLEVLGKGGMGIVYKAYHPGLKQIVAIKLIKTESQSSEKTIQRFLREMQIMAKLEHPGIVKILNSGEENGRFYLIMEYVQGNSLEKKSSQLTLHEKIEILMILLEALSYAHQRKIIHRDLKLENIMLSETGHPKILDFGLAKELVEERESLKLTQSGILLGTALYMSPEQIRGEFDKINEQTDLYAIGVCLYKLISGHYPFEAKTFPELARKIEYDDLPLLSPESPNIHRDIDAILLKALEKHPEKRYTSAENFAEDLRCFLSGHPVKATFPSWSDTLKKWSLRHQTLLSTLLLMFVLFVGFLLVTLRIQDRGLTQQFEEKYALAKKEYEPFEKNSTSFEAEKQLFRALHLTNVALQEKQEPKAEALKWNIGEKLLQMAYQTQSYPWANYLIQELEYLQSVPQDKRSPLRQQFRDEKQKDFIKQHRRFSYWKKKLNVAFYTKEEAYDAIFEILKMSDPKIVQDVAQEIRNGIDFLLQLKISPTHQQLEYSKIFIKLAKYWDKPELALVLNQGVHQFLDKVRPVEEYSRKFEEVDYMVLLFQALIPYSLKDGRALRKIRWEMGFNGLFYKRTKVCYKKLLQTKCFQNEDISGDYHSFDQGRIYAEKENYPEAIQAFTRAIQENLFVENSYTQRGNIKLKLEDYSGAILDYTEAIRINPQFVKAYSNRGNAKTVLKDYQGALADFTEAIRLDPQFALIYNSRGNTKAALKDYEGALQDYTEAIRLDPQLSEAYHNRGITKLDIKNDLGALIDFTEAIRINPQFALSFNSRGNAKYSLMKYEGAILDYSEAIRIDPQISEAYYNLGNAKYALKDYDGAIQDYTEAIRLNPQDALAYDNRGKVKATCTKYAEALADYTESIRLNPQDAFTYYHRGKVEFALENYAEALADYTESIRLNPQYSRTYYERGFLYYQEKNREKAQSDFIEFLKLTQQTQNKDLLLNRKNVFDIFPELRKE